MYELICALTQGADHIKHGNPCEDYGQVFESEFCKIFAVADGHGDSNCPRSRFGSKKACEIAISEMTKFCSDIKENEWELKLLSAGKGPGLLVRQLIASIFAKWIKAVDEDFKENPLTEEERAGCKRYIDIYDRGERLEHIYGTTLIAGLMTERYLLLIQQGDGRCVVFNADGSASQPIPWDDKCFANITTSLCDADAVQRCRYCITDLYENPIIACLAGSDGVEDSFFSMELMHSYYRDLLVYASKNGIEALNEHLQESLPEFSKKGSGDDVTICGVADKEKVSEFESAFKRDNEIAHKESALHEIEERLNSMNGMGKMDALRSKYKKALEEFSKAKGILDEATKKLKSGHDSLSQSGESLKVFSSSVSSIISEDKVNNINLIFEQANRQLKKAREEFAPIRKEYKELLIRKAIYKKEKSEIKQRLAEIQNL